MFNPADDKIQVLTVSTMNVTAAMMQCDDPFIFLANFLYFVKANGIFFVQVVRNPRPAVYVASQFVRKLSVDGHHQRQRPGVMICLGMLSLFRTIDYYFFYAYVPAVALFVYAAQGRL